MIYFFLNKNKFSFYINYFLNFIKLISLKYIYYLNYKFFKFFAFVGLGFKKRVHPELHYAHFFLYFGHRHWIIFKIPDIFSFIYIIRRRSLVIFSRYKFMVQLFSTNFKSFLRENAFKIKGFLEVHTKRRWLFMRRLRIRGLKVKLSKKQKFL